jgi:hypothetical protein
VLEVLIILSSQKVASIFMEKALKGTRSRFPKQTKYQKLGTIVT